VCGLVGVLISIVLASVAGYAVAILLGAVINIALFGFLVFAMPEDHFTRPVREAAHEVRSQSSLRQHAGDMKHTFRASALLIRATPVLLLLVVVELFFGASSEGFDRLWEASFLTGFNMPVLSLPVIGPLAPIAWFGVFEVISTVLGLTVLEVARRRINTDNHVSLTRVLMGSYTVAILATLAFAFTGNFALAAAMVILRGLAFGLAGPIQGTWLNQSITDSRVRATVLSMNSQANALGQIAGGPGVGWIGNAFGIRAAIAVAALLLTPTLALFGRTLRRKSLTTPAADLEVAT
jgi:predicted MFS family arabinose efflux permease